MASVNKKGTEPRRVVVRPVRVRKVIIQRTGSALGTRLLKNGASSWKEDGVLTYIRTAQGLD